MNATEVQEGIYVRWIANRTIKSWDVYGVITSVNGRDVTIKTFDDFTETTIGLNGEAMQGEVTKVTKAEVVENTQKAIDKIKTDMANLITKENTLKATLKFLR